ncbi:MAG: hypothetical protein E7377_03600 [Clostridiales bacterium]|nr:hypothetical protein [Clostridiales bacterium]
MNKSVKRIGCLLLTAAMGFSIVGCKDDVEKTHDAETRPVVFATDALDGNFNPFFATSATDSKITSLTQIGMLTTDEKGNLVYGENEPTVVLDYKSTMLDSNGEATTDAELATKENGGKTEYEFIIKNGIKFSDGTDLTIKDVLFNLYVYLDPAYMGSATIYSTDIVGLKAYRTQDLEVNESLSEGEFQKTFYAQADQRIVNMINYLAPDKPSDKIDLTEEIAADIATVKEMFQEEVESDWSLVSLENYKDDYTFTEKWQAYFLNEGIISVRREHGKPIKQAVTDANGDPILNDDGEPVEKYVTTLDAWGNEAAAEYAAEIEAVKNDETKISAYMAEKGCTREEAQEFIVQDYAIETVYTNYTTINSKLAEVISYWATGSNVRDEFAAEARSEYFQSKKEESSDGGLAVKTIEGITTYKTSKAFNGSALSGEHEVLKVVIHGVDPKAVWNFSFAVTPMAYYSGGEALTAAKNDNGTAVNQFGVANQYLNFGVSFASKEFFDNELQDADKNGLPVGAGVYKASNAPQTNGVSRDTFYKNNWVYYERNTYFDTVGGDEITNAKIKYLRYRVVGSDKIIQALQSGDIDFGEPQATPHNLAEVGKEDGLLNYKSYQTNGYGYVGINPKYVPDIEVRRAIMKAMNTASIVKSYYTDKLADVIYRPMSNTSWAYPSDAEAYYELTTEKAEIQALVESAGKNGGNTWTLKDGLYTNQKGETLSIVFTIAGETTDHPAYEMFQDAAKFLNECGFDVSVTTDITALKKLATGGLEVWAAAWSSTIDPDLYQVYHKDSKATSIKNWGYETIFADNGQQFGYEQTIINNLSEIIEKARATLNEGEDFEEEGSRKWYYADALDMIMDLAVELPTYQRNDLVVYNKTVINAATLNQNPTANAGVYDRLWEVDYV